MGRTPREAKQWVDGEKDAVVLALAGGDTERSLRMATDLVRFQCAEGRDDLAAKSLCDLAKRAERLGALECAKVWLKEAHALAPNDPIVWAQIVHITRTERRPGARLEWSERMLAQLPDDALALTTRANALHAVGHLDEALEIFDRAVALRPDDSHAWTGRASVRRNLGQFVEAEREFEEATRLFPLDPVAWSGLAGVVRDAGALGRAEDVCRRAVCALPAQGRLRVRLGEVLLALGRPGAALAEYEVALRLERGDLTAHRARASALISLGQGESALRAATNLLEHDPRSPVARIIRAEAEKDLDRLDEAVVDFREVLGVGRLDATARAGFALTMMRSGRVEQADRILMTAASERYDRPATSGRWSMRLLRSILSLKRGGAVDAVGLHAVSTAPFIEPAARAANALALEALLRGDTAEALAALRRAPSTEAVMISATRAALTSLANHDASAALRVLEATPFRWWCLRALDARALEAPLSARAPRVVDALIELVVA